MDVLNLGSFLKGGTDLKKFFTKIFTAIFALSIFIAPIQNAEAVASTTRIKDIAKVQGVRSNQLLGYGLVVGLNGTGDSDDTIQMIRSTISLLKEFGITVAEDDIDIDNTAAVIVLCRHSFEKAIQSM